MMRWIVAHEPEVPLPRGRGCGGALMIFGAGAGADDAGRRLPRVRAAAASRSRRSCLGLSAAEVEASSPCRWSRRCNGVAGLDDDPLEVGPAAVVDRADLQAGTDLTRRAAAGRRSASPTVTPDAADLGGAAGHAAAALVDQPGHEDRPHRRTRSRMIDMSMIVVLERSARGCCACPAWPTWRSGASGSTCYQVQVDPARLATQRRHARRRSWTPTADALDAGLLQFTDGAAASAPAASSTRRTSGSTSGTSCRSSAPRTSAEVRSPTADGAALLRLGDVANVVNGPPAADRRRGHQRRPRPAADRREAAWAQHARGDRGRRGGAGRARSPGLHRHRDRHDDLPAGDASSSRRSTT